MTQPFFEIRGKRWLPGMLWLGGAALLSVVAMAQQPQEQQPLRRRSAEELAMRRPAGSREVVLDVVVTDRKGHPVSGLKLEDFTLYEGTVAQRLSSLEEHAAGDAATVMADEKLPVNVFTNKLPFSEGRATTVILLDALDTSAWAQSYLQDQLAAYMRTVPAGTQMAIFQLDTRLRMIQGVTDDVKRLRSVTAGKRIVPGDEVDPGQYTAQGAYLEALHLYDTTMGHLDGAARRQILADALQALGQYLATFPGRKNLVWFTPTIPFPLTSAAPGGPFPDSVQAVFEKDANGQTGERVDVLTLNQVAVYPVDMRSAHVGSPGDGGGRGREMGEYNGGFQRGGATLDQAAMDTGGKAFRPGNGLAETFAEVVDSGSHYYTLRYTPTNQALDGALRALKIETKQAGTVLEYRHGYYCSSDGWVVKKPARPEQQLPLAGQTANSVSDVHARATMAMAMALHAAAPLEIVFKAKISALPDALPDKVGAPGKAAVKTNFMDDKRLAAGSRNIEIRFTADASAMHFTLGANGKYRDRLEFITILYDEEGKVVNGSIAKVQAEINEAAYKGSLSDGIGAVQAIAVPLRGRFFLRLGVHDVGGNLVGAVETPLDAIKLP